VNIIISIIFGFLVFGFWRLVTLHLDRNRYSDHEWQHRRHGIIRTMAMLFVGLLICVLASGCSSIKPNNATSGFSHTSHPGAGFPLHSQYEVINGKRYSVEDSLDLFENCVSRDSTQWYYDVCLGLKLHDTGFTGPPVTATVRVGKRWRFGE